jgi:hypothetical protein
MVFKSSNCLMMAASFDLLAGKYMSFGIFYIVHKETPKAQTTLQKYFLILLLISNRSDFVSATF